MHALSRMTSTALLLAAMCSPSGAQTASAVGIYEIRGSHIGNVPDGESDRAEFEDRGQRVFSDPQALNFAGAACAGNGCSDASGYVQAGFGWMRMYGVVRSVSGASPTIEYSNNGRAVLGIFSQFTDELTISDPARNGTQGSVFLSTLLDGGLSPALDVFGPSELANGYAEGYFGATFLDMVYLEANTIDLPPTRIDNAEIGGTVSFIFGQPFSITVAASSWMQASSGSYGTNAAVATFVSDFSRTLTWGGMSDLRDADGNPVADYSVSSLSGTDYRYAIVPPPVPEPATLLLWLLGLSLLAARQRWQRRLG